MATVALIGLSASVVDIVDAALKSEGFAVVRVPLDADTMRGIERHPSDVLVVDGHPYANTHALLTDLRKHPKLGQLPVVLLGPPLPAEVPQFEVVQQLGRTLDMEQLIAAVKRAAAPARE